MSSEQVIQILLPYRFINHDNWPGKTQVEFHYADDPSDFAAALPGIDVLMAHDFTAEMAQAADCLRLIHNPGAGLEKIDFASVPAGCIVASAYEHERPIAEWVLMAMMMLSREAIKADQTLRAGSWAMSLWNHDFYPELDGRTLGILGLGRIGRHAAMLATVFGMRAVAATRTLPSDEELTALPVEAVYPASEIDPVLREADYLLLSLPLTDATQNLIDERALSTMKESSYLINVARAGLVDERALYEALVNQRIAGAAIDAWWREPAGQGDEPRPATYPFWELDNVLLSPHVSGITDGLLGRRLKVIAENIDRFARGEPLMHVVKGL